MLADTRKELEKMAENDYREFSSSLIPGVDSMLGIRLPELRKMAKLIVKGNWRAQFETEDVYFEERMLRGMLLNYANADADEMYKRVADFVPLVDNWSVCDSVFGKMDFLKKDRQRTWEFIQPYLYSKREFEVRIALVIMMQHLLKCDENGEKIARIRHITGDEPYQTGLYLNRILEALNRNFDEGYYAYMAAAWLLAEAYCSFPVVTGQFLLDCKLDDCTYNKALQKIVESHIPDEKVKNYIRSLKRK